MNSSLFAKEILKKQLLELSKNSDLGFSVGLVDDNDFFKSALQELKIPYMKADFSRL
jgi:hypothetical protein